MPRDAQTRAAPLALVLLPDAQARARLRRALEAAGWSVEEAGEESRARALAADRAPDLVLVGGAHSEQDGLLWLDRSGGAAPVARLADLPPDELLAEAARLALALRRAESALERDRARLDATERLGRVGRVEYEPGSGRLRLSAGAADLLGPAGAFETPDSDAPEMTLDQLLAAAAADGREELAAWFARLAGPGGASPIEFALCGPAADLPTGSRRLLRLEAESHRAGSPALAFAVREISAELAQAGRPDSEGELDPLTGLPGRARFLDELDQAVGRARLHGHTLALVCLDLAPSQKSPVPAEGRLRDALLGSIGERLRGSLRDQDLLSRRAEDGGDIRLAHVAGAEFALVLELSRPHDASNVGRRLIEILSRPFVVGGREIALAPCGGIALFPEDGAEARVLLERAEEAVRRARAQGTSALEFHSQGLNVAAFEKMTLEASLRTALERRQLQVHYQPRISIQSGRTVGVEALVRWKHPELGLIPPMRFIPLAEETGLIIPIGQWVLEEACRQNRRWQEAGLPAVRVAVNLSAVQFRAPDLFERVMAALTSSGLEAPWLELELTESILMKDADAAVATLRRLSEQGLHLAIDDFGTGYSSLSYLKRFPIDALKIDQSFVREINTDPDDAAIATSIILMGHSLKLCVVAEGVETKSQLAFLRVMQCDEAQGYLFSPPVPAEELAVLLSKESAREAA